MLVGDVELTITMSNKICILDKETATGKSYLLKLLKSLKTEVGHKDNILLITYDDVRSESAVIESIKDFKGTLILVDRFDLYFSLNIVNALIQSGKACLVDLKNMYLPNSFKHGYAMVNLSNDKLEVREI